MHNIEQVIQQLWIYTELKWKRYTYSLAKK